jgi:hypothetical protein
MPSPSLENLYFSLKFDSLSLISLSSQSYPFINSK